MARELKIHITGDNTDALSKLGQTDDAIDGVTKTTERETKKQEESWRRVGAAIGAVFSLQQLSVQAGKVTDLTSRITDLSAKMGLTTDEAQELDFAARQNGSSLQALSSIMAIMGRNITEGDKSFVGALGKLNLGLDDLQGKRPADVLTTLATAISQVPDPLERSALAMQIFGRSGAENLPLLTSNIGGLRERARELGIVIDQDLIKRGDDLGDLWDGQKLKVDALRTQAMLPLLSVFVELPTWMQTVISLGMEFSGVLGGVATSLLVLVGPKALFATLIGWITGLPAALGTAGTAIGTFVAAIGAIPLAFVAAGAALFIWRDDIIRDLGHLARLFPQFVTDVAKWFTDLHAKVKSTMTTFALSVLGKFSEMFTGAVDYSRQLYEGVKTWLVDKFMGIVNKVGEGKDKVVGFFKDMWLKVVGGSYVPDMVRGIEEWIGRLDISMVAKTEEQTRRVESSYQRMMTNISNQFSEWGNSLSGWVEGVLPGVLGKGLGAVGSGLLSGIGGLLTGGISNLISMGVNLAMKGLSWLGGKIAGLFKNEGAKTNDTRDAFMNSIGGLPGAHGLIVQHGNDAQLMAAFDKLYFAGDRDTFTAGRTAFERRLAELQMGQAFSGGFPGFTGGGGMEHTQPVPAGGIGGSQNVYQTTITVNYAPHIEAMDAESVQLFMRRGDVKRAIAEEIITALPPGLSAGAMA